MLIVILLAVGMVVSVFIGYRQVSNAPELLLSSIKEGANLSLGKIRQPPPATAKKNGVWRPIPPITWKPKTKSI